MSVDRLRFAVLIDGDNAQADLMPQVLAKVEEFGVPVIGRVYGDWTQETLKGWRPVVYRYALETPHSFNGTNGKNATDIALAVDAVDMLWERRDELDGFVIVSSDSDFTHLAARIRRHGLKVIGVGRSNTPQSFRESCDEFISTESLQHHKPQTAVDNMARVDFRKQFKAAYIRAVQCGFHDDQGWVALAQIKVMLADSDPDFQAREYRNTRVLAEYVSGMAQDAPNIVEIQEAQTCYVTHVVRIQNHKMLGKHREIGQFRSAYKAAVNELNGASNDGWVSLSSIGSTLRKLFPGCDPNQYRETAHKQLKKVVEKLVADYPDAIELKSNSTDALMRMKG